MTTDNEELEDEEEVEDDEELEDDTPEDDESDDSEGDEDDDGSDLAGGSGDDDEGEDDDSSEPSSPVERPVGKAVLDLLASDQEAQRLLTHSITEMIAERQAQAARAAEAQEFQELITKGDLAEVGRRVVERVQTQSVRTEVADSVLKEQFTPVYEALYAQPEMQNLNAEEREALRPERYQSDAHYVVALQDFIASKRNAAAIEAEVQRRLKALEESAKNKTSAGKATGKSAAAMTPAATGPSEPKLSSSDRIKAGLRRYLEPDSIDGEDE